MVRIEAEQGHVFRLPLPPALAATKVRRRLTVTLAWLTPTNFRHKSYRTAYLWCVRFLKGNSESVVQKWTRIPRARGTVAHRILEGESIIAVVEGERWTLSSVVRKTPANWTARSIRPGRHIGSGRTARSQHLRAGTGANPTADRDRANKLIG